MRSISRKAQPSPGRAHLHDGPCAANFTFDRVTAMPPAATGGELVRRYPLRDFLFGVAMLAVLLAAFDWITGDRTGSAAAAERRARAMVTAESLLIGHALNSARNPVKQGVTAEGFVWRIFSTPTPLAAEREGDGRHRVAVELRWQEDGRTHVYLLAGRPKGPASTRSATTSNALAGQSG